MRVGSNKGPRVMASGTVLGRYFRLALDLNYSSHHRLLLTGRGERQKESGEKEYVEGFHYSDPNPVFGRLLLNSPRPSDTK